MVSHRFPFEFTHEMRLAIPGDEAWASAWPLAAQLDPQRLEEVLARMEGALQQLQGYGRRGVEGCKEGKDGNGMGIYSFLFF